MAEETAILQAQLDALHAQVTVRTATRAHYATVEALLTAFRAEMQELGALPPPGLLQQVAGLLLAEIRVAARPGETPPYQLLLTARG